MNTIHSKIDVGGLLTWDNRDLRGMLGAFRFGGKRAADVRELRSQLVGLLKSGVHYLPMGEPCEGWTDAEGCPGHERAS